MPLYIPAATSQKIKDLDLSDWIVQDVFDTGVLRPGSCKKFKKYEQYGYTVQITYVHNDKGEDVLTFVQKW